MSQKSILGPNDVNSFFAVDMIKRLSEGHVVTVIFGGDSMLPLINGGTDVVELTPFSGEICRGDIYLFRHNGRLVIHRLLRIHGDDLLFRGDNNRITEHVTSSDILARLTAVIHPDGSIEKTDTPQWRRRSSQVVLRRNCYNIFANVLGHKQRLKLRWFYFVFLLLLMWAPLGFVAIPLNNFVFGLRLDHLLHSTVYIPCALFMYDFFSRRRILLSWLSSLLLAFVTETGQYMLPYRGFDINDMVANFLGVSLGCLLFMLFMRKFYRIR